MTPAEILRKALDDFEESTRALPVGHEDRTKGASSYNWRMACLTEIRARACLISLAEQEGVTVR